MAKRGRKPASEASDNGAAKLERGAKTKAIRTYLTENRGAMPKAVVTALGAQGITVSPNMVSITKAKMGIRRANRRVKRAVSEGTTAPSQVNKAAGLEAALTLYKAAREHGSSPKTRQAFLALVEILG